MRYTGNQLREARFPLGGIGAGCVHLDGSARFCDWEIANRPNKESYTGFSHIAVKAERAGKTLDARALHGHLQPPYMGKGLDPFGGYTYGPARETLAGVPHFESVTLEGRFPMAEYAFAGEFPGEVTLRAWSPFEPNNDFDSSLPLALFDVAIRNPSEEAITYSIAFTLANPDLRQPENRVRRGAHTALIAGTTAPDRDAPEYGELCVATDAPNVCVQQNWYRGTWFDGLNIYWQDFRAPGTLKARELPPVAPGGTANLACPEHGVLCVRIECAPGETAHARFALSWYYPNYEKYWAASAPRPVWRNWYATVFDGAESIARYGLSDWERLYAAANGFAEALYDSTLPEEVIDAAGATLAVLKSPTCLRLSDGSFYGWEGSHARFGSCEGSCQHVWNYQYALPLLFPALERSMRENDFRYNIRPDGALPFRVQLPLGTPPSRFRPCADGQMGAVIKTYREWAYSGDTRWMASLWPFVKRVLAYAWSEDNPDRWDPEESGLLTGRQHHTLDMELFGPNSWLTGMYLAALEAGARMADAVGDADFAAKCRAIQAKGKAACDRDLFNGEYFIQVIDLQNRGELDAYAENDPAIYATYWSEEHGELKYQIGQGCSIDQLLGQWHADLCGLGDVFSPEKVESSLYALYRYNFLPTMKDFFNPCRIYCLQDEGGLLICAYPEGEERPKIAVPYAEETMHGFEYAAACHMILRGLENEGLECVRAVRKRYDGERRDPWNEIECGGNYARSMAAWALVPTYQGLRIDMTRGEIFIRPLQEGEHRSVWSFGGAWGKLTKNDEVLELACLGGALELRRISCGENRIQRIALDGEALDFAVDGKFAQLARGVRLQAGTVLRVCFA